MTPTRAKAALDLFNMMLDASIDGVQLTDFLYKGDVVETIREALTMMSQDGWKDVEGAPEGKIVIVCGNGPVRLGIKDNMGNWRTKVGRPKNKPKFWYPMPPINAAGEES